MKIDADNVKISDFTINCDISSITVTGRCSYDTQNVTLLHPGETQMIRLCILVNLDNLRKVGTSNFLATLSVTGTVLDEHKLF